MSARGERISWLSACANAIAQRQRGDGIRDYQRPVSPTEWFYLAGQRIMPPFAIQLVVEGRGRIELPRLTEAVAVAATACPGSRLVRDGRTWRAWLDADPMIGTIPRKQWPPDPAEATTSGKLCQVLAADDALVFRAFHGVMDGRGVLTWAADVFRALRGEPPVGAPSTLTDYAMLEHLGEAGKRPPLTLGWRAPLPGAAGNPLRWRRRTVDGNHPGLVAKVAAAIAAHSGHPRSRFMVPVDLRRHVPGLVSTANLSLPVFLDSDPDESWERLHERLLRALADRQELAGGRAERAGSRIPPPILAAALKAMRHRYLCSSIVSHLGRIDLDAFGAPGFEASTVYSLPVHAPLAPLSVVATEPPGRTELTVAHHSSVADADALLDAIEFALSPGDLRRWSGNRTRTEVPADQTITALFERQVDATPDAIALTGPQGTITYQQLDQRADVVARELRSRGVGNGTIVGLLADRTVEAIAGLWGILKAGAAYLPLDPQHPDERIGYLLADARARLCLATRKHAHRVSHALILDDLPASGAAREPVTGDLAYVIYTSGSTGRPKGVQIEHRNLVNYVTWASELYQVTPETRFALFTSLAFDLTGTSIILPLLAGGSLALVPDDLNHLSLRTMLESSGANALKLTPAHLDLISRLDLTLPAGFGVLVVGGEQLKGAVAARAQRMFGPDCRIVNEYGPTEATIGCVVHVFDPDRDGAAPGVPIGRPVANTTVRLLDADRRPVARGEIGELYLTGDQLARGYLGGRDRHRFVRLADGTRAYRTGDLARLTADDVLEYLGRSDNQIKVRGHRVEPGEIEAAMEEYPGVRSAVVVARDQTLCAYVVAGTADGLREHLAARLPRYMVPAAIVPVAELPQTTNGKIDVEALARSAQLPGSSGLRTGPRQQLPGSCDNPDPVMDAVAKIWARVLGVDVDLIGPDTEFHALGGDSLGLIEMVATVSAELTGRAGERALLTELGDIIREPTPAAVCAAARRAGAR
jgi:amino acid adenylation domain-containing protein